MNPPSARNYFVGGVFVGRHITLNPAGEAGTEVRFANVVLSHLAQAVASNPPPLTGPRTEPKPRLRRQS